MNLRKTITAFVLFAALSLYFVTPAFAVTVTENENYTWEKVDDKWTCTDESGFPITGWAAKGTSIYYLNKKGVMRTGWIIVDGTWYYTYKADDNVKEELIGTLATDTWIDNYYVDKEGVFKKTR